MKIIQIDLSNRQQVRQFIDLPERLHKDNALWTPPLRLDMQRALSPSRHPFYRHSQAAFFLLYDGQEAIGRIAAIDNRHYNDFYHAKTGFFYYFDCVNDQAAAAALFEAAFSWMRQRGLNLVIGPKGLTPLDGHGLLIRGFEHPPAFGMPWNPPWYVQLVETQGFAPRRDSDSGYLSRDIEFPQRIHALADRVRARRGLSIMRFTRRRDLKALIPHLKTLYNQSLSGMRDNYPLDEAEAQSMANQLLWFANPRLIKAIVNREGQPVGFLLAYPDIAAALRRTRGRLAPLGWAHVLHALKHTSWLDLNGAGLIEKYRGLGGTAILFSEIYKTATEFPQFKHAEVVQIGKENEAMQREMRNFGIRFYKTHRIYEKSL